MSTIDARTAARHPVNDTTLPISLAMIAGVVDVTTFVLLDGFFSAHVTGNLVSLAAGLALHRPLEIASVLSIPLFVVVTAVVTVLVERSAAPAWSWVRRLLTLQLALVVASGVTSIATNATRSSGAGTIAGLLAVGAMAGQNALLHLTFRKSPTTAVMTGNLVAATVALTTLVARRHDTQDDAAVWRSTWPLIAGFFAGCFAGALACGWFGSWAWLLPMALCGAAALVSLVVNAPPDLGPHR